jgi:sirohydrochlorin cobaltochelatase
MPDAIERALQAALAGESCDIGQVAIRTSGAGYILTHRDDQARHELRKCHSPVEATALAKSDDAGKYRPLKTAPNLKHGWQLEATTLAEVRRALEYFYPGRLGVLIAHHEGTLKATALRETLDRQTGMYRVAAKISDEQLNDVVGRFCRSDGGCLRTILWRRDAAGAMPSNLLPPEKYDPVYDQAAAVSTSAPAEVVLPLLCQEACNLVVAGCRKLVKAESAAPPAPE